MKCLIWLPLSISLRAPQGLKRAKGKTQQPGLNLQFWPGAVVMMFLAAMTASLVTNSARSGWFVGVLVLTVYLIFAMTLYLLQLKSSSEVPGRIKQLNGPSRRGHDVGKFASIAIAPWQTSCCLVTFRKRARRSIMLLSVFRSKHAQARLDWVSLMPIREVGHKKTAYAMADLGHPADRLFRGTGLIVWRTPDKHLPKLHPILDWSAGR